MPAGLSWPEAAALALLAPALLVTLCRHLWALRWSLSRDRASALPLPKGSMGWPFLGETLHWLLQILARVFSRAALESYLPRIQKVVSWELRGWCMEPGSIAVYSSAKTLTFRIAARILLGLRLEEKQFKDLAKTFEQLVENLFSLPLNIPFSGLRKGIKARDMIHEFMEKAIQEKLQRNNPEDHSDALDFIINSAKEHGKEFTMQELKESAIELIFAAFFTTASASTSMILLLLKHPSVIEKIRQELVSHELYQQCNCCCPSDINLEKLSRLRYLDCVIKEVLRVLPPVSGGYRTALQTFELDGYQIPKGWSVMYSIRDTHETAAVYQSPPSSFDPDRFSAAQMEAVGRFHYIPFGGGARSCIGKELAQAILKLLAIELVSTARWELATPGYPAMQTVPIVHPVDDGLQLYFHSLWPGCGSKA
ncbi:cytochrome P450 26C1 isoform X5 [Tyto alba]|uniref:cytochrome P450 26C1 isoform X5 n=1 Tax=Tyto alba TaxID=56313 RepID=UPI001403762A|nr:cytochrome P450 26C1 isoform X5 [Tyto alba]